MISQGTPAATLLPNQLAPPAPPTMENVDQEGTSEAPVGLGRSPASTLGAPLGDFLAAKGQTPTSAFNTKLAANSDAAAKTKAASGTPPQPGDWARQLVAGAQGALGGVNRVGASLGDAAAVGTVPRGGGALTGIARTMGARSQRLSQEKTDEIQHAEAQARTLQLMKGIYRQDQTDRLSSYKLGADFMDGLRADRTVEDRISQDEITRRARTDPNFIHSYYIKPTGEEPVYDADGKQQIDPKTKQPVFSPLYSIAPIKGNAPDDPGHEVTESEAKLAEANGVHIQAGAKPTTGQWAKMYADIMHNQAAREQTDKANDYNMSSDNKQKLNEVMKSQPQIRSYILQTPGQPLDGLNKAEKNNQANIDQATADIAKLQKSKDPNAAAQIADRQQKLQQWKAEDEQIDKAIDLQGPEAQTKYQGYLEEQRKDAEKKEHEEAEDKAKMIEANAKAEEARIKGNELNLFNPPASGNKQGADYLASLKPENQEFLNSVHEGRSGNKPIALQRPRTGEPTELGLAYMRAFPGSDLTKAENYPKMVKEYSASGPTGKSIMAMGTAINHTRAAYDNTGRNSYIPGTQEHNRYDQDITFVAEELGKYVKGGVATKDEVDKITQGIHSDNPNTRKSALENAAKIIEGRRSELQQGWTNGLANPSTYNPPMPSISPEAEANFQYLKNGGKVAAGAKTVKLSSPDGKQTMDVPADQVEWYKSAGAKVVQQP
jgi:hypothetical protein